MLRQGGINTIPSRKHRDCARSYEETGQDGDNAEDVDADVQREQLRFMHMPKTYVLA